MTSESTDLSLPDDAPSTADIAPDAAVATPDPAADTDAVADATPSPDNANDGATPGTAIASERKVDDATTPGKTFAELGVEPALAEALAAKGITHAFPIQELTLPLALGGADIIGQARTGTGKTLGFGLPLLSRIDVELNKTQAMVIVPTRELCIQVADDLMIGNARGVRVQTVYGGVGYDEQIEALTTGVHVVVGTPGRTIDHLNKRNLDLSNVHVVVLDEADEMLDMGFLPDVELLLGGCPEDRQTMLFSATMPTAVVKLARRFMQKPTFMQADTEAHETAPNVKQYFFTVHRMDKPRVLARVLQTPDRGGAFVFCRTKRMCDRLVEELETLNISAVAVHGDLRQTAREKNLDKFREGKADVLVATEVAARGLDVDNVTHVFNYDCPDDEKMYLHRIGRTARAGNEGVAVTFSEFNEAERANLIRKKVDVETEMVEIFSTSDELTEWFGLPTERPWDHLSKKKSGNRSSAPRAKSGGSSSRSSRDSSKSSGSSRDDSRRGGRDRDNNRDDNRGSNRSNSGRDDNRDDSRRSNARDESRDGGRSGGRSRDDSRDSGRNRSSNDDGGRDDKSRRDRSSSESSGSESRSSTKDSSPSRERSGSSESSGNRTRTRTRTRSNGDDSSTSKESSSSRGERGSSSSSSEGRTDGGARSRSRRQQGDGDSSSNKSNDGNRSSRNDDGGGRNSRDNAGNNDRSSDDGRSNDRGGRGSRNDSRGGRGSNRSRDDDRGGRGNSGRSGGNRNDSSRNDSSSNPRVETTKRGDDARGEGTPRHSRRVEVEHLP